MAKKKKLKFNFGAIVAAIGAILAIVAFFVPVVVQKSAELSMNGMQIVQIWLETMEENLDNAKYMLFAGVMQAADEAALTSLQIFTFAGVILGFVYLVYAALGTFFKPCKSKLLNIILSGALLAVGIGAISSAAAIQSATTTEILGKTIVGVAMSAGAFLTAAGGAVGLVATLFYRKK